jgi:putative aminopeptidase FrvX
MKQDYELLKRVLSVPTKTYKEDMMIEFLTSWLVENDIPHFIDDMGNIYATKQTDEVEYFPCVVAHTDTVHELDTINIKEMMLPNDQNEMKMAYKSFNDSNQPTGIGGDDKCGVYICLEVLRTLPNVKVALFVSEETGCHGSKNADKNFFSNVGYVIQCDAPGNWMVSEYCMGTKLFDKESEFFKKCDKVLTEGFNNRNKYQSHPYTDVYALKNIFDFACINFAVGYYNYHTKHEYVIVEDVYNTLGIVKNMIGDLGYKKYEQKNNEKRKMIF